MKFAIWKVAAVCTLCLAGALMEDLSSELREILDAVTPRFEESLKRAFQNEGVRRQNLGGKKDGSHKLDDVLVTLGDNIIELKNLRLLRTPDFRVNHLSADLGMLTLTMTLNLGNLRIEGEYEANNKTLQKLLPITHTGKIAVTLENVLASGRVGLFIREDSFVAEHYDLEYTPEDVTVIVSYHEDDSTIPVVNEITEKRIEETLASTFWPELTDTITNLLHRQLGAVIVEDSVTELLADNDAELREHSRQQALKANRLLDSLLCTAKGQIVAEGARALRSPDLSVVFRGRQPGQQRGLFEAKVGYMQDLSTLTRSKDMSLYENGTQVIIYGSINLREFKHGYEKYKSEYMKTVVEGSIRATAYRNKIFLKVSLSKSHELCLAQLERVQVRSVNDIDVDVSALGSLSWLAERVESWIVGKLRNQGLPILEQKITNAFEHAIRTTDCAALLTD